MLQRGEHGLVIEVPVVYSFTCAKGHAVREATALAFEPDALTLDAFKEAIENFTREVSATCGSCRAKLDLPALDRACFLCEFDDGAGVVIAWYAREWRYAFAPGARAIDLIKRDPASLSDLSLSGHLNLTNEDCRANLGRVFSLRSRWVQLVDRFAQRGRPAIADNAAAGYTCFVYQRGRESSVAAIARVLVPEYDPANLHVHGRVDPAAHRFFSKDLVETVKDRDLVLEAIVDLDEVERQIGLQAPKFGLTGDAVALDPRALAAEAIASARLLGEQVFLALAARRA